MYSLGLLLTTNFDSSIGDKSMTISTLEEEEIIGPYNDSDEATIEEACSIVFVVPKEDEEKIHEEFEVIIASHEADNVDIVNTKEQCNNKCGDENNISKL